MLLSMTGFGEGRNDADGLSVRVEVRTVNSRYFKLTVRSGDAYSWLEPEIETVVRRQVKRGTVQVWLRIDRAGSADQYQLNTAALTRYRQQLAALANEWNLSEPPPLGQLLLLPGVVEEDTLSGADARRSWPAIQPALDVALEQLAQMRIDEGRAMAADLRANCDAIAVSLDAITARAPVVVTAFRERLADRIGKLLAEYEMTLNAGDLVREVSLFAERSDISEEIVRLRSHVEQFRASLDAPESSGRKLDFLTQEMFREANTIGSKANDVEIARHVVDVKAAIEKIREMIQNVE